MLGTRGAEVAQRTTQVIDNGNGPGPQQLAVGQQHPQLLTHMDRAIKNASSARCRGHQKIKVPILHAVAEHDHIVPYDAAKHLIATDKEEVMLKGGHVSLFAGPNAIRRLWPKLDSWLGRRSI